MPSGQPSHLRAALRLLREAVRRRGERARDAALVPRRKLAVERHGIQADPGRVRRFLAVTGGTGIRGLDGEAAALPPTYSALWETALALELLTLEEAPFPWRGLIHLESELVCVRPLYRGDLIRCRVELDRAEPHPQGVRLMLKCRNWSASGQLAQENSLGMLVRTAEASGRGGGGTREEDAEWRRLARWALPAGQGRRYARVSGDFNPIHLWSWSSRLLGFRQPILHGYCTEAMVAHALIEHLLRGDPHALRRLQIRFGAPLALPAEVELRVAPRSEGGGGRFQVVDPSSDELRRPYADGVWVGE